MSTRPVHWHEGMFLRPQHLQASQRYQESRLHLSSSWNLRYGWGLRAMDLDETALANHRLVIHDLQARLPDGTMVVVPRECSLDAVDLKAPLERESSLTVFLGVPRLQMGNANISRTGSDANSRRGPDGDGSRNGSDTTQRFFLDSQEIQDENTGDNPQLIQVRLLNVRILLSNQDQAGYEVLPIARVRKSSEADTAPQIDPSYIPPLLGCDAWSPLVKGILMPIYDRIGQKINDLANMMTEQGIGPESNVASDVMIVSPLRALNEAYAALRILVFAQGVHPLDTYLELCRLIGQLSIFGKTRRPPELPAYDHDNLGYCFQQAKIHIDALLDPFVPPKWRKSPFIGTGPRLQVSLEPKWLEQAWSMFVGVKSQLPVNQCADLLAKNGGLDMKIGSSERVDHLYNQRLPGLVFDFVPQPPRALPIVPGLIYFQVRREAQESEWKSVREKLTLAIRLNQARIGESFEGKNEVLIRTGAQSARLEFWLYVLEPA